MLDAESCNGIVTVAVVTVPVCGENTGCSSIDRKEGADGSEVEMGADPSGASAGADSVANSGRGTWVQQGKCLDQLV